MKHTRESMRLREAGSFMCTLTLAHECSLVYANVHATVQTFLRRPNVPALAQTFVRGRLRVLEGAHIRLRV